MNETKYHYHYDQEADVLYVSFGRSEHVTGIELADNILLRLDTGKVGGTPPRAVGLTFVNFARMLAYHQGKPLTISLDVLRNLPDDLWQAVIAVMTSPPVSDFLAVGLSVLPQVPPLPELATV
ncbi:MAG: DUF2283 domain-containing protein [Anaerolineae bacterium]|jgi:uncharacterized protein YuzE|nr:DUF2283 domain-containing protein [Anaerolineae bacterium]MDH7472961.1 DUF2283 domain-containing protein [Anaerolineae bacterium]